MFDIPSEYYFQDLPAEVMAEIMADTQVAYPDPSWGEIERCAEGNNTVESIQQWYDSLEESNLASR